VKLPFYSLRTGIFSYLTFLIASAMLLINVVMVEFAKRDLVQAKVLSAQLLIRALEQNLVQLSGFRQRDLADLVSEIPYKKSLARLLDEGDFSGAVIVGARGEPLVAAGPITTANTLDSLLARRAMETRMGSIDYSGSTWGVIWLSNKDFRISEPILFEGRSLGGITITGSLTPIYQALRKSEKVMLFYIILDTMFIVLVGIYLLSRIVVKPIHNLLHMTDAYQGGEIALLFDETSRNEIARLSRSLGNMLKRLDENKRDMKTHISSLEQANKELQQAQNELLRSEKLASVGRLAAGVAHEIGNPIGIIFGYLELIKKGDISEEEREDFLDRIQSQITRIDRIIGELLGFSRPSSAEVQDIHVHDVIRDTTNMLKPQPIFGGIQIDLALNASNDTVRVDPSHLQQVLVNIMMNAADALSERDADNDNEPEKKLIIESESTGRTINIRLIDNGPGMPEEELPHILDPFYTTKDPGKGTGLGLSVSYRIVEGMNGTISVESVLGKGTTILIDLPLCPDTAKVEEEK
jgi:two-component system NtrC family sensor kinase